jgi:hypothetical protein
MDFTAGLMPLETALTQMLNRISRCMTRDAAVSALFSYCRTRYRLPA